MKIFLLIVFWFLIFEKQIIKRKNLSTCFQCSLKVNAREARIAPNFSEKLVSSRVSSGEKVVLRVAATGQPIPGLAWQKVRERWAPKFCMLKNLLS